MMPSLLPFMVLVVLTKNSKWSLPKTDNIFVYLFAWHKNSVDFRCWFKGMYKDYCFDTDKIALYHCRKYAHILLHVCLSNQYFYFTYIFRKQRPWSCHLALDTLQCDYYRLSCICYNCTFKITWLTQNKNRSGLIGGYLTMLSKQIKSYNKWLNYSLGEQCSESLPIKTHLCLFSAQREIS